MNRKFVLHRKFKSQIEVSEKSIIDTHHTHTHRLFIDLYKIIESL